MGLHFAVEGDGADEADVAFVDAVLIEEGEEGFEDNLAEVRFGGGGEGLAVIVEGDEDFGVTVDESLKGGHADGVFESAGDEFGELLAAEAGDGGRGVEDGGVGGEGDVEDAVAGVCEIGHRDLS
jgi:hypothetical protein